MTTGHACYRCSSSGRFRLSWLAYPKAEHDYACLAHATQSKEWALVTRSSEEPRW